jgi:hypothetical protein
MANTILKKGKHYVRQARLPRGAYHPKPLGEVLSKYKSGKGEEKKEDKRVSS